MGGGGGGGQGEGKTCHAGHWAALWQGKGQKPRSRGAFAALTPRWFPGTLGGEDSEAVATFC